MTKATRETSIHQLIHVPNTKKTTKKTKFEVRGYLARQFTQAHRKINQSKRRTHEQSKVRGKFKMAPDRASSQHITSLWTLNRLSVHRSAHHENFHPRRPRADSGARESLNGRKNISGTKKSKERREELFSPFFTFLRAIYIFPPV